MIDPQKEFVDFLLSAPIAFALGKINDLKVVLIGIQEIERFNASDGFD